MSSRYWVAATAIGLILVAGLAWYGWRDIQVYQLEHAQQRDSAAKADTPAPDKYLECAKLPLFAATKCAIEAVQADAESERSQHDLNAQQDMAEWAYALLLVSVASIILSMIGLVALFVSLAQTRQAIKDGREIGEAQVQAYLSLRGAKFFRDSMFITIDLVIRNSGQSPANAVTFQATLEADYIEGDRTFPTNPDSILKAVSDSFEVVVGAISSGADARVRMEFPAVKWGGKPQIFATDDFRVKCRIEWADVFDKPNASDITLRIAEPTPPMKRGGKRGVLNEVTSNYRRIKSSA
ncbi:MAG: hypothetical protein ACT6RL_18890 [Neoaquamicrobium sediminum]|uniref:hypothetical protein n=1 Tax=Neoaquamicrobium sediminum TaxID=1849104 RepID=UPI0040362D51